MLTIQPRREWKHLCARPALARGCGEGALGEPSAGRAAAAPLWGAASEPTPTSLPFWGTEEPRRDPGGDQTPATGAAQEKGRCQAEARLCGD